MTQQAISFLRLEAKEFHPGEAVFVNYSGFNGWWALGEVVKRGRTQVLVQFINPEWPTPRWCSTWMMRKAADVPVEWHAAWLSRSADILERMQERSRRARRRKK